MSAVTADDEVRPYEGWAGDAYAGPFMTPEEWRSRIGKAVERRRRELFPKSRRVASAGSDIGDSLWGQIERGIRIVHKDYVVAPTPERASLEAVGRRLDWRADWFDRLLRGEEPVPIDDSEHPPVAQSADDRLTSLEARFDRWELLIQELVQWRSEQR